MKIQVLALLFSTALAVYTGCEQETVESPELPPAPELVASPPDTALDEQGFDAVPDGNAIQVCWRTRPEYTGYALFRRAETELSFRKVAEFGAADSCAVNSGVEINIRYYYYLKAKDESNNWSPPSDTLDYELIAKVFNLFSNLSVSPVEFRWHLSGITPDLYILKLFDDETDERIWQCLVEPSYRTEEVVVFNNDGTAKVEEPAAGRRYRWRVDCRGTRPRSGSESAWARFSMP